ncbi:hypothetical protein PYCC9005_002308 [Savitreella phatthalungensis]
MAKLTARHLAGVITLGAVVLLWVASSFLMRSIFGEDKSYDKPFFVTWINTGTFSLYLAIFALRHLWRDLAPLELQRSAANLIGTLRKRESDSIMSNDSSPTTPLLSDDPSVRPRRPPNQSRPSILTFRSEDELLRDSDAPLSTLETAKLGCIFSILWFAANYFGNLSLAYTNVASFTIVSSLSGFFTLALGRVLGVESFTRAKWLALAASLLGVALVVSQDTRETASTSAIADMVIGDFLALIGAMLYGGYTVFLKLKVGHEERVSMPLFFGFVGVFNLLFLWPAIIILDRTGIEPFALPATRDIWIVVAINASITFVSDYLWVWAMLLTSPLVVTVGISMSIPLALLGDHILYNYRSSLTFFLGAALVFGSFIVINLEHKSETEREGAQHVAASAMTTHYDANTRPHAV